MPMESLTLRRSTKCSRAGRARSYRIMLANNETGVIQPVAAAAEIVHRRGGVLHVDAVQAAGRMPVDIKALAADLLTLSAHKLGGAKGVGALIAPRREHPYRPVDPRRRAGAGLPAPAPRTSPASRRSVLRQKKPARISQKTPPRWRRNAQNSKRRSWLFRHPPWSSARRVDRLPNTTLVAIPGAKAETLVIAFDLDGVAISSGAACSSGKVAPSHVLAAMGVAAELARGAIRVSLGPTTTDSEIDRFLNVWKRLAQSLSKGETRPRQR